ncbi:MAG: hypothetical protein B6229_08385 [Spirochaetaceae bacterium 4572_7]|nr:MAG: hypothetical protein B6229_08385 [Spirochaetaceae bacterium 4572_7]
MAADLTKDPDDFEQYGTFTDKVTDFPEKELEEEMDDYDMEEDNFDSKDNNMNIEAFPSDSLDAIKALNKELISLRQEIHGLKNEIAAANSNPQPTLIPESENKVSEEDSATGFFNDPDEDSITLTFDELDNLDDLVEDEC